MILNTNENAFHINEEVYSYSLVQLVSYCKIFSFTVGYRISVFFRGYLIFALFTVVIEQRK